MASVADDSRSDSIGVWAWAAILLASALVLYTGAKRFLDPVGEKYIEVMPPGNADFAYPFNGARALLRGLDPYVHQDPDLVDPWLRDEPIDGVMFRQFYPPSHLLLYVPLAWATGGDLRVAGRIWFHLNIVWIFAVAWILWRLARLLLDVPERSREALAAFLPFFFFAFGANQGACLGLERGQSDIFSTMLCWSAVLLWLLGKRFWPMFLVTWAMTLKGYAVLLAAGLGLLALLEGGAAPAVLGALAALAVNVGPVVKYLPEAAKATTHRANMFWNLWYNHSFKNLAYEISPSFADAGRGVFSLLAAGGTVVCWTKLRRATRDGAARPELALWLALFTSGALATVLGASALSCSYNLVMVLPGAILLALGQRRLRDALPPWGEPVLGALLLVLVFCLFVFRFASPTFPTASVGILGLPLFGAGLAIASSRRAGREVLSGL